MCANPSLTVCRPPPVFAVDAWLLTTDLSDIRSATCKVVLSLFQARSPVDYFLLNPALPETSHTLQKRDRGVKNISAGCSCLNPPLCHTYETGGVFQRRHLLAGELLLLSEPHCSYTLLIPLRSPISSFFFFFSFSKKGCTKVVPGQSESFYFTDYSSHCQVQFPCLTVNNERKR